VGVADPTSPTMLKLVILSNGRSIHIEISLENGLLTSHVTRSLKVTGTDTDLSATHVYLLVIHSNHGPVLYCFPGKHRFRLKIANFSNPIYVTPLMGPVGIL